MINPFPFERESETETERERERHEQLHHRVSRVYYEERKLFGKVESEIKIKRDRENRERESMRTTISTKTVRSQGARASLDAFDEAPFLHNPRTCRRTQTQMHTRHYQVLRNLLHCTV
jgi:hypothetical protein